MLFLSVANIFVQHVIQAWKSLSSKSLFASTREGSTFLEQDGLVYDLLHFVTMIPSSSLSLNASSCKSLLLERESICGNLICFICLRCLIESFRLNTWKEEYQYKYQHKTPNIQCLTLMASQLNSHFPLQKLLNSQTYASWCNHSATSQCLFGYLPIG